MATDFLVLLALGSDSLTGQQISDKLSKHYNVLTAKDAEEVYHKVHHSHPDLAIMDYTLKNMNPIELYEGIEFLHPDTTYVLCVTSENLEVARRIWHKRAIDYVRKPYDADRFVDDVHKIVRHIKDQRRIKELEENIANLQSEIASLKKGDGA